VNVLALDIDGVLLDPGRGGLGPWPRELESRFGVDADRLRAAFFEPAWPDVIVGRRAIEPALAAALDELGWAMTVDQLLACWFEADLVLEPEVVDAATAWAAEGARLVLVTNQEHRRATFLRDRLGALLPISALAYSAALGLLKSDPAFYRAAAQTLGLDDHDTVVFVDDTLDNVEAARLYGWSAVHFTKNNDWHSQITSAFSPSR
jgi:putative hydrolase of the HAD superfamily